MDTLEQYPRGFNVTIFAAPGLLAKLTPEQIERLQRKLDLVKRGAALMAQGMLKGTLKYDEAKDQRTPEEWLGFGAEDCADALNYMLLAVDAKETTQPRPECACHNSKVLATSTSAEDVQLTLEAGWTS
jgi:hypothetical protein